MSSYLFAYVEGFFGIIDPIHTKWIISLRYDFRFERFIERRGNVSRIGCYPKLVEPHPISQRYGDG